MWLLPATGALYPGTPEDLVLSNNFAAFVDQDAATGTCTLHTPTRPAAQLVGDNTAAFWTRQAVQRKGFVPITGPTNLRMAVPTVAPSQAAGRLHPTVRELLRALRQTLDN